MMKIKLFLSTSLFLIFLLPGNAQPLLNEKGSLQVIEEPGIRNLSQAYIEENRSKNGMEGFRIQIYNGRKDACMNKRSEFIGVFPTIPVYTLYEAPEYRIQVGDFRTQMEAEKFLNRIIEEFSGSFVVKTKIKLPPLISENIDR